jgi:large subunit ribosomal protein L33
MAKKSSRVKIGLVCEDCKSQNYITIKNKLNTSEAIKLKKHCPKCRKHTFHKEKKKLG